MSGRKGKLCNLLFFIVRVVQVEKQASGKLATDFVGLIRQGELPIQNGRRYLTPRAKFYSCNRRNSISVTSEFVINSNAFELPVNFAMDTIVKLIYIVSDDYKLCNRELNNLR